ncbi:unnamed protein product [Closterium sp. NIES-53]
MESRRLRFDAEGRPIEFSTWQCQAMHYLTRQRQDGATLWAHASGALKAPLPPDPLPTDPEPTPAAQAHYDRRVLARDVWDSRDAATTLALTELLPSTEAVHFAQVDTAQGIWNAVVAPAQQPSSRAALQPSHPAAEPPCSRAAQQPSRPAAEPPSRPAAEQPSRPAAEPSCSRAAEPPYLRAVRAAPSSEHNTSITALPFPYYLRCQSTVVMATPSVLAFDAEGRAIDFDVWVDDLQLFLQCDRADGLSLSLTSPLAPLQPLLLMLTPLFTPSGPRATLLHVLLCIATSLPPSVRTLVSTRVLRPCTTL